MNIQDIVLVKKANRLGKIIEINKINDINTYKVKFLENESTIEATENYFKVIKHIDKSNVIKLY